MDPLSRMYSMYMSCGVRLFAVSTYIGACVRQAPDVSTYFSYFIVGAHVDATTYSYCSRAWALTSAAAVCACNWLILQNPDEIAYFNNKRE